jgi:hypothetical protein
MGDGGATWFAIEGGRYSGLVAVDIPASGYPIGVDGTADAHSYSCMLSIYYRCPMPTAEIGWCGWRADGTAEAGAPDAIRSVFVADPSRPPVPTVTGTIDRDHATTLPMHY